MKHLYSLLPGLSYSFVSSPLTKLHFTFLSFPAQTITVQLTGLLGNYDFLGEISSNTRTCWEIFFEILKIFLGNEKGALLGLQFWLHIGCKC